MANNIFQPRWLQNPLIDADILAPAPLPRGGYMQPGIQPAMAGKYRNLPQEALEKMDVAKKIEGPKNGKPRKRPPPKPNPADEFGEVDAKDLVVKPRKIEPPPSPKDWKVPLDMLHKTPHEVLAAPGYWYVATPYTNYPYGREHAFLHATEVLAALWAAGVRAFGPISHTHMTSVHNFAGARDWDHDIWMSIDQPMMDAAHGLICVAMDGFLESKGVMQERKYFRQAKKTMWTLDPKTWHFTHSVAANGAEVAYWNA